jgi:hypothetical protein
VLREIKTVLQERGAGHRRWFESDGLDLVVWLDRHAAITGFQLCYDLGRGEHALTWREESGFAHNRIDTGDETPLANRTPVLEADGPVPWNEIAHLFNQRSKTLEPTLRRLIDERLAERGTAGKRS